MPKAIVRTPSPLSIPKRSGYVPHSRSSPSTTSQPSAYRSSTRPTGPSRTMRQLPPSSYSRRSSTVEAMPGSSPPSKTRSAPCSCAGGILTTAAPRGRRRGWRSTASLGRRPRPGPSAARAAAARGQVPRLHRSADSGARGWAAAPSAGPAATPPAQSARAHRAPGAPSPAAGSEKNITAAGRSGGRPFNSYSRLTASGSSGSQARPYTVSAGNTAAAAGKALLQTLGVVGGEHDAHVTARTCSRRGHNGVAHALRGRCGTYFGRCYTHVRAHDSRPLLDHRHRPRARAARRRPASVAGRWAIARSCCCAWRRRDATRWDSIEPRPRPAAGASCSAQALEELPKLVDVDALLSDSAWK